jgi:uncharacterized phage infection (PIP) family protein YhgE
VYVKKNSKKLVVYPEEREGRAKDANKKLKSQIKNLKKQIKRLEEENKTLNRAYNKSCDYIENKLSDKNIEQVIDMVNNYEHKETKKGRAKSKKEKTLFVKKCPQCDTIKGEGYIVLKVGTFEMESCNCGYRNKKADTSEGIEGS